MANTSLNLAGLDFDSIKLNLKQFLGRSSSPFKDYNFDGSNISQLLDLLAYNTFLNSYYLNMVASEMFLDSAELKDSVVSHAKSLGYLPRSFKSALAKVSFTVTPTTPSSSLLIPKGTSFTTKVGSNTYTFSTQENSVVDLKDGIFTVSGLDIYEGIYITDTFVYDESNTIQRFVLSNATVDTDSIGVIVIEDEGSKVESYYRATSFLGVSNTSTVYFLQAAENSQYEVIFGDGVIGKKPKNGSIVTIDYRVCNGQLPNGASIFDIDGNIQGETASSITTLAVASGGDISESIEQIKYHAPRFYQNQDRAITASDYENILKNKFPEIVAVSAQGGEDRSPPEYGKVYVAVDVQDSEGLSETNKKKYLDYIKPRCSVNISPVFIEPRFLFCEVYSSIKYDISKTTLKETDLSALVKSTISKYNKNNLNDFYSTLYYSKLVNDIDETNISIVSNTTDVIPYKLYTPSSDLSTSNVTFKFNYEIATKNTLAAVTASKEEFPVFTSEFTFNSQTYFIEDDGAGVLNLKTISPSGIKNTVNKCGTVDYATGTVTITDLKVTSFSGRGIKIFAIPSTRDITSAKDTILKIEDADIFVTIKGLTNV